MWLLDFLQNLSLPAMFLSTLAIGLVLCWTSMFIIRLAIRTAGLDSPTPLPIRDTIIGATSAIFALMMAFSAAGIWNDTLQASTAVQREANALENVVALAGGLPSDLTETVKARVRSYAKQVIDHDWPAMTHRVGINDRVYDLADSVLVDLINTISLDHTRIGALPTLAPLIGQIIDARSARLARITLANAGVSAAQWLAMMVIALAALCAVAVCNNHHFGMQAVSMHLYVLAAVAAFFVILAHDRPFIGVISVSPAPIVQLATEK
jgi:Protein of unknown function (DUF4239)